MRRTFRSSRQKHCLVDISAVKYPIKYHLLISLASLCLPWTVRAPARRPPLAEPSRCHFNNKFLISHCTNKLECLWFALFYMLCRLETRNVRRKYSSLSTYTVCLLSAKSSGENLQLQYAQYDLIIERQHQRKLRVILFIYCYNHLVETTIKRYTNLHKRNTL